MMNKKILWKIEELWKKYYKPIQNPIIDISANYDDNSVSQYYPDFYSVTEFDFFPSDKDVFSDEYGKYKGLAKSQLQIIQGKPVYLFDNHNKILYPFVEIKEATGKIFGVVHIDAHPDDALFAGEKLHAVSLKNVTDYISKTRISDFFDAISEAALIGNIHRITHSDSFEFFLSPEKPYILSLDIDIFGPEGDFAELRDKVRAIAIAWSGAEAVCIAMSPGFIDQGFAKGIIEIITKP